jgi:hypothetical protein
MKKNIYKVLLASLIAFSAQLVWAENQAIHMEEQAIKMMQTKMHEVVNSLKDKKIDMTLYGFHNQTYVALFSSLDGVEHTEMDANLVSLIREDGQFQADNYTLGSYQCKHVIFKASDDLNQVFFVGRDCQSLE